MSGCIVGWAHSKFGKHEGRDIESLIVEHPAPDNPLGWQTEAPSAIPYADGQIAPVALDRDGLRRVRDAFAASAARVAKQLGPGHTVVTILADGGSRYQSKLFNPEFLRSKNLPVPQWLA